MKERSWEFEIRIDGKDHSFIVLCDKSVPLDKLIVGSYCGYDQDFLLKINPPQDGTAKIVTVEDMIRKDAEAKARKRTLKLCECEECNEPQYSFRTLENGKRIFLCRKHYNTDFGVLRDKRLVPPAPRVNPDAGLFEEGELPQDSEEEIKFKDEVEE